MSVSRSTIRWKKLPEILLGLHIAYTLLWLLSAYFSPASFAEALSAASAPFDWLVSNAYDGLDGLYKGEFSVAFYRRIASESLCVGFIWGMAHTLRSIAERSGLKGVAARTFEKLGIARNPIGIFTVIGGVLVCAVFDFFVLRLWFGVDPYPASAQPLATHQFALWALYAAPAVGLLPITVYFLLSSVSMSFRFSPEER